MTDSKTKPIVCVVIPTYNRKDLFTKALESVINQTYKNLRILVSDNCSTDGTEEICKEYLEKDSRIEYYRQTTNVGMVNNHNFIFQKVKEKYFSVLNDDDWFDLNYIEKCVDFIEQHPDYTFVTPAVKLYTANDKLIRTAGTINLSNENMQERLESFLKSFSVSEMATGLFSTKVLKQIYEAEKSYMKYRYAEDITLIVKFLVAGRGMHLEDVYLNKRENGGTRQLEVTPKDIFDASGITYKNYYKKVARIVSETVLTDGFYGFYINQNEKKKVSKKMYNYITHPDFKCSRSFAKKVSLTLKLLKNH